MQQHVKRIIHCDIVGLLQGCKVVSKIIRYHINIQKSIVFLQLWVNNPKQNRENKSVYNSVTKKKILRNKCNKIVRLIHWKLKNIVREWNKWKNLPCLCFRRFNIVKMTILLKMIYRFNPIPIKILPAFLATTNKFNLKFIWKCREP